jgi:hypothetical protein
MSKKSFIDSVEVKNPCGEDWDQMQGNERVRFCSHCSKHVNNLSEMTRKEAMRLVRKSDGNLCVRYITNPATRRPMFAEQLRQITRRTPSLAAGVMTASIALSGGAYAQTDVAPTAIIQPADGEKKPSNTAMICGVVTDPNGAVIPQALVSLTNEETSEYRVATASMEGYYEFTDLVDGKYKLKIEAGGFEAREISSITIADGSSERRDSQLRLQQVAETVQVGRESCDTNEIINGGAMFVVERFNALVSAVEDQDLEDVKARVGMGARINSRDKGEDGITPLHAAVRTGNMEIAQYLLDHGAKVNARDSLKRTPLMMMDDDAKPELLELLLRYGAKTNLVDKEKNTILMHFVENEDKEITAMLVRYGVPVNAINKDGKTALMIAAENNNSDDVQALLEGGASVSIGTKKGDTAWSLATDAEIRAMLEQYGAVVRQEVGVR